MATTSWILHVDGDGFFAYCEIARFPHLRGKPVVVGADRGIACAMTYEAKQLGITRAMPIFKIRKEFPHVTILSSHFDLYEQYATKLARLLESAVDQLERYSIDECFATVNLPEEWSKDDIQKWLSGLKSIVQATIGLKYSFGLARTKVLAKVASKRGKPDGCTMLMPNEEIAVLADTAIESIWGIGWRLSRRFQNMRVKTALQFVAWPQERVVSMFAAPVQELWHELRGKQMFSIESGSSLPKSLQSTKSFAPASTDIAFVSAELLHNTDIVFARMRTYGVVTNGISIFLKTVERRYHAINIPLVHYTDSPLAVSDIVSRQVKRLFKNNVRYKSTGITVWNLRHKQFIQEDLFGAQEAEIEKGSVMEAIDEIREKFGKGSIGVLSTIPSTRDRTKKHATLQIREHYVHGLPLPYLGEVT